MQFLSARQISERPCPAERRIRVVKGLFKKSRREGSILHDHVPKIEAYETWKLYVSQHRTLCDVLVEHTTFPFQRLQMRCALLENTSTLLGYSASLLVQKLDRLDQIEVQASQLPAFAIRLRRDFVKFFDRNMTELKMVSLEGGQLSPEEG